MISISKATLDDAFVLSKLGRQTFLESHGHSASKADIDSYINRVYTPETFETELKDPENSYHIIRYHENPAGFSKIVLNCPHPEIRLQQVTKMDRLYILKNYYDLKLGQSLFDFNKVLSLEHNQSGTWLYVWKENPRAISFYTRNGSKIMGSHDFRISETHSNPNHLMFLEY